MSKILIKRGLQSNTGNLTLEVGELALATDTGNVYIGLNSGKKQLNSPITSVNNQTGDVVITDITGTSEKANKLSNPRTISLSGGVSGTGTFDGSKDLSITTTIETVNSANKLSTPRTITLSGDVSGNVSFDGSKNVTINSSINTIDGGTF